MNHDMVKKLAAVVEKLNSAVDKYSQPMRPNEN